MQAIVPLLSSLVVAALVAGVALITVQNAEPVSLKFLVFQSVPVPVGLVLSFCVVLGLVGTALVLATSQKQ
ncbi:MAG: lipopolysaccharide assembly protein LapA domain-containing protein [Cyanobacteria bacterium P01_H01_bin.121]